VLNNQSACERARRTRASERGKKASEREKEQANVGKNRLVRNGGSLGNLYISRFFVTADDFYCQLFQPKYNLFLKNELLKSTALIIKES
jgi:hypothetical protein